MFSKGRPEKQIPACIWAEAKDVHVRMYIVYRNAEGIACFDPQGLFPVGAEILEDLFLKSLTIIDNNVSYNATSLTIDEFGAHVGYMKVSGSSAVPASVDSFDPEPIVVIPELTRLTIGTSVLVPTFSPEVFEYATTTTEISDLVTLVVDPDDTTVTVTLEDTEIDINEPVEWESGVNTLTIYLGTDDPVEYVVVVTAE